MNTKPTSTSPAPAGLARTVTVAMIVLALGLAAAFVRTMPEALERAALGEQRFSAAACDSLKPTDFNPALGMMPARAPNFTLKDYLGRDVSLASLRGNVVLLNLWATWCRTCAVEIPSMERLVERMRGKPFKLLAVSVDEDWPTVRGFFQKGTPIDVVLDADKTVPKMYGTEKFPETFLIDKSGVVRHYIVSDRDWNRSDAVACLDSMMAD